MKGTFSDVSARTDFSLDGQQIGHLTIFKDRDQLLKV